MNQLNIKLSDIFGNKAVQFKKLLEDHSAIVAGEFVSECMFGKRMYNNIEIFVNNLTNNIHFGDMLRILGSGVMIDYDYNYFTSDLYGYTTTTYSNDVLNYNVKLHYIHHYDDSCTVELIGFINSSLNDTYKSVYYCDQYHEVISVYWPKHIIT